MDAAADVTVAREAAGYVAYVRRTARRFIHAQTLMTSCVKHLVYVATYWHLLLRSIELVNS